MRSPAITALFILLLIGGCSSPNDESSTMNEIEPLDEVVNPRLAAILRTKTKQITTHQIEGYVISIADLDTLIRDDEAPRYSRITKEAALLKGKLNVRRAGSSLVFKINSRKTIQLTDIPYTEDDETMFNAITHEFSRDIEKSNYWEVNAFLYEYFHTILIHKNTGDSIHTIGTAYFSPNNKLLISSNQDMDAGYTPNGFEFYSVANEQHRKLGKVLFDTWGPHSAEWLSEKHVLIEQIRYSRSNDRYISLALMTITPK